MMKLQLRLTLMRVSFSLVITSSMFALLTAPELRAAEDDRPVVDDSKLARENSANAKRPTLHLVGDSTMKSSAPMRGWGQEIGEFFDLAKINVVNHAISGRSSRSFQQEGHWDKIAADLQPGDFVLVQFGHNDAGKPGDPTAKGRFSLPGDGEQTAEVKKIDGTTEFVHAFGWYLRKYGNDARAKGARIIFCSMVPYKSWTENKINRSERDTYVKWTADAAKKTGAAFINLNEIVAREYDKLGPEKVEPLFADKSTHTTAAGAVLNAQCVVAGLRALPGAPLDKFLSEKGKGIQRASARLVAAGG